MPWQDLLSPAQRVQVLALPTSLREYEELYTLTPVDLEFVAAHRTDANRLGVATQLCFLRHPGRIPDTVRLAKGSKLATNAAAEAAIRACST